MLNKNNIKYRRDYEDDWIYYAVINNNDNRIYIYRNLDEDRLKKRASLKLDNSKMNCWDVAGDYENDYEGWDYFHPIFWKQSKSVDISIEDLQTEGIPCLEVDEDGEMIT